ncbi:ABC transporter ATP-binding protein [Anaerococcus sp. AGMB00486]|uniref:ABC transporter ATP-binding protein n=1 Tax=Anaerococcus faecalis TaxID=2742993 RepID=A0ABX2NA44_9FIRM|nr:ABC transporter ATP-binding protein [Anaerococcus faecalis]NVF11569.1 ABC transporter ATP-binding protein [Anaerococcus faecalis]
MKNYLINKYSITEKGASGLCKAIFFSTLKSLSFMTPIILMMYAIQGLMGLGKFDFKICLIGFLLIALLMVFILNRDYITTYNETYKESANLRIEIADRIKDLPLSFYTKTNLTDLSQTIMKDVETIEHALSHALPGYYGFLISFLIISILLLIGSPILGISIIIPTALSIGAGFLSAKNQSKATSTYYKKQRRSSELFQEIIDLQKEIREYKLRDKKEKEILNFIKVLEKEHIKSELGQVIPIAIATSISNLSLGLVMFFGLRELISGNINVLYLAGYLFAAARIIDSVTAFNQYFGEIMYINPAVEKIRSLKDFPIIEGEETNFKNFDIEGENVEFSYLKDKKVIDNISFKAREGESTALVGPSGCGKTTLLRLMAKLYDYDKGSIKIDKKDIKTSRTEDLFSHISMVFQDVLLIDGTVMDNIRIGKMDASDEEVLKAGRLASCDDFVNKLKDGYNTKIGENGSKLSGGERQRISIARAFLKDADIILLDEIAANLDVENEKYIQDSLNKLSKDKTLVIISHRMKSIQNVDQIIVMKDGRIEKSGKHEELLKESSAYKKMIESSRLSEEFVY